jgi:hypothetical protein
MGDIPAKTSMVSSIITFPLAGSATIESDTTFNITVQMSNIVAGFFTNADATYYAAPQALSGGLVVGHTHVTVQDLGASLNPTTALDATQFAFFKGINDAGNGKGLLSATVTGGLPAGNYRVCTLAAAANHQPVLMPVAQRGTADDCTKFTVIGSGTTINAAANDGSSGEAAAALAASAVAAGPGAIESSASVESSTSASGASASSAADNGSGGEDSASSTSVSVASVASSASSSTSGEKSSSNSSGKSSGNSSGNSSGKSSGDSTVQKVTVIETFFEFLLSLGGLCPSVGKNGDSFSVLDELFDDLASAASAACSHQYQACISFTGPGFSFEECEDQQTSCSSAASTASATASTAATITATVTVPVTAIVTGSVLSTVATISATSTPEAVGNQAQTTAAAVLASAPEAVGNQVQTTAAAVLASTPEAVGNQVQATSAAVLASANEACSIVTVTVQADSPASTEAAIVSSASFSNSTASATSSASAATSTSSAGVLGGIAAPPVTNSGDSTRPFEVNGNTFVNKAAAVQRSCDIQFNGCADAFNGGKATGFDISDCSAQETACLAA